MPYLHYALFKLSEKELFLENEIFYEIINLAELDTIKDEPNVERINHLRNAITAFSYYMDYINDNVNPKQRNEIDDKISKI